MCSLFGMIDYGNVLSAHDKNRILAVLSQECEIRGTDATGIAYNFRNNIHVYKRPVAARRMHFRIPNGVNIVMGHTRMATQGAAKLNRNNHPWATKSFALAHNGVLWNDRMRDRDNNIFDSRNTGVNYFTFYFTTAFLLSCVCCCQSIAEIFRVLLMLQNNDIAPGKASLMPYKCSGFCNIFNAFPCNYKQNISIFKVFGTANGTRIRM